jgi:UDP-N-acetylmuramate-alanine ligase
VAVATEEGIDDEAILRALESFQGTGRRFDFLANTRWLKSTAKRQRDADR